MLPGILGLLKTKGKEVLELERLTIDIPDLNDSFSRAVLEGSVYNIRFTWNEAGQFWSFGLFTSLHEPIVQSVKIVPRFPLNLQYIDSRLPNGVLGVYTEKARVLRNDFKDGSAVFAYIPVNQGDV